MTGPEAKSSGRALVEAKKKYFPSGEREQELAEAPAKLISGPRLTGSLQRSSSLRKKM